MWQYQNPDELYHYGVLGMKWGVRKKEYTTSDTYNRVVNARKAKRQANKAYKKAYNSAYRYSRNHPITQFTNDKRKKESDNRWRDAIDKADASYEAKQEYKSAKKNRNDALKKESDRIKQSQSWFANQFYSGGTRSRASQYIVDNNMSLEDAKKKAKGDAWKTTATFLALYGAYALAKYK